MRIPFKPVPLRSLLLACGVLALPLLVSAAPDHPHPPGPGPGPGACAPDFHNGPRHPPGPPMGLPMDFDAPPPFLMGLKLNETQQDKVFNIMHAAAPGLREQSKALHKAREALDDLGRSAQFSNDSALALAQTQGKAESQLAFLRTKMEHDIFAVLDPEQQADLVKHQREP